MVTKKDEVSSSPFHHSISRILFSALQTSYLSHQSGHHLSTRSILVPLSVDFPLADAPTMIWVARTWGLPRSTLVVSNKTTSLWHFSGSVYHRFLRRHFSRRHTL